MSRFIHFISALRLIAYLKYCVPYYDIAGYADTSLGVRLFLLNWLGFSFTSNLSPQILCTSTICIWVCWCVLRSLSAFCPKFTFRTVWLDLMLPWPCTSDHISQIFSCFSCLKLSFTSDLLIQMLCTCALPSCSWVCWCIWRVCLHSTNIRSVWSFHTSSTKPKFYVRTLVSDTVCPTIM